MIVTELRGNAQVFTLKDGSTFRIFARETKEVSDSNVSDEMKIAESMGLIVLVAKTVQESIVVKDAKEEVVTEEVVVNKKSGGVK